MVGLWLCPYVESRAELMQPKKREAKREEKKKKKGTQCKELSACEYLYIETCINTWMISCEIITDGEVILLLFSLPVLTLCRCSFIALSLSSFFYSSRYRRAMQRVKVEQNGDMKSYSLLRVVHEHIQLNLVWWAPASTREQINSLQLIPVHCEWSNLCSDSSSSCTLFNYATALASFSSSSSYKSRQVYLFGFQSWTLHSLSHSSEGHRFHLFTYSHSLEEWWRWQANPLNCICIWRIHQEKKRRRRRGGGRRTSWSHSLHFTVKWKFENERSQALCRKENSQTAKELAIYTKKEKERRKREQSIIPTNQRVRGVIECNKKPGLTVGKRWIESGDVVHVWERERKVTLSEGWKVTFYLYSMLSTFKYMKQRIHQISCDWRESSLVLSVSSFLVQRLERTTNSRSPPLSL